MSLLSCPCCRTDFECHETTLEKDEVLEGYIECENGHKYCIHNGVLDFGSMEQGDSNQWSEYYKDVSYEELDASIDNRKTENQKQIQKKFIADIVAKTSKLEEGILLDIASGRGMLLKELIRSTNENVHIISSDLSFAVLMNDRIKFKDVNPKVKVSYVACDATNLPFKDKSIDMICTFVGYVNMLTLFEAGVKEASRVIKIGAPFINSLIYMKKGTPGFLELEKIFASNELTGMEKYINREDLLELHQKYYTSIIDEISFEGIAEDEEEDLLPYQGEWFANAIMEAKTL